MNWRECKSLIVFGGSFDPPHNAHVELPILAMQKVGAEVVVYVPAAISPLKRGQVPTPAEHRLAMLRLAIEGVEHTTILTDELNRMEEPSYTIDTLEALLPKLSPGVTVRLLIGGDQLRDFHRWRSYERIIQMAEPLVMVRPPDRRASVLAALPPDFDTRAWSARLLDLPLRDISASDLRDRVALDQPIAGMVAPAVEAYIRSHHLYSRQS